jgi:hypothetical protein
MNRNFWGVENFEEITIRHSKFAAQRFAHEAAPALTSFADSSPTPFVAGIKAARERIVARSDEDRDNFLRKRGFSKSETAKIGETVLQEEGRPPESLFDFVQGITALARGKAHQDARLELEGMSDPNTSHTASAAFATHRTGSRPFLPLLFPALCVAGSVFNEDVKSLDVDELEGLQAAEGEGLPIWQAIWSCLRGHGHWQLWGLIAVLYKTLKRMPHRCLDEIGCLLEIFPSHSRTVSI